MTSKKREIIIETALKLFCREGFHATSIEHIVQESGVAKMTLYNHFNSKEELILVCIRRKDELWRNWLMNEIESRNLDARESVLSVFDCLYESIQDNDFNGCFFIAALQAYPEYGDPIHTAAMEHKRLLKSYVADLLTGLGLKNPDVVASKICLLVEGILSEAIVSHNSRAALIARDMAAQILDNAELISDVVA